VRFPRKAYSWVLNRVRFALQGATNVESIQSGDQADQSHQGSDYSNLTLPPLGPFRIRVSSEEVSYSEIRPAVARTLLVPVRLEQSYLEQTRYCSVLRIHPTLLEQRDEYLFRTPSRLPRSCDTILLATLSSSSYYSELDCTYGNLR
jgi:hypothetical protein